MTNDRVRSSRIMILICAMLGAAFLSSCSKGIPDDIVYEETNDIIPGAAGSGESFSVSESGIVFARNHCISFYDFAAEESYVLCGRVNCKHSDSSCFAWFDSPNDVSGIALINNRVFYMTRNAERNRFELLSRSTTGEDQIMIAALDIGKAKPGAWILNRILDVYYGYGTACVAAEYILVPENDEELQIATTEYVDISLGNGQITELTKQRENTLSHATMLGLTADYVLIEIDEAMIPQLSETEFEEACSKGEFDGELHENGEDAYQEYLWKWYPANSGRTDSYVFVRRNDGARVFFEKTPMQMTFDEAGYLSGTLPKYVGCGTYQGSFIVEETMRGEHDVLMISPDDGGKKEVLLMIADGGTLAWERRGVGAPLDRSGQLLYCEYQGDQEAIVKRLLIESGKSESLYTDARNITFRIVDQTEKNVIGKVYTNAGFQLYSVSLEDYLNGKWGNGKRIRY